MSKNVKVNGVDYTGVSQVQLPTTDGATALFKDVDEITTPSGSVTITENGTHDVTNYAQAVVNVGSGVDSSAFEGITECKQIVFTPENQNNGTTFSVAHGCSATPDIVLIVANEESADEAFRTNYQIKKYVAVPAGKFATAADGAKKGLRAYGNRDTDFTKAGEAVVDGENIVFTNIATQRWATVTYTMWCIVF